MSRRRISPAAVALALVGAPAAAFTFVTGDVSNPSFETGSFSSWTATDIINPFYPLQVGQNLGTPWGPFFSQAPTDGVFSAVHGFDGGVPGQIIVAQDITVSTSTSPITFDYRGAWDLATFGASLDRTFEVVIRPPGGGPPMQTDLILTAMAGTLVNDTGTMQGSVDVSSFAGQMVQLSFEWNIPEPFSGPAHFELDNIQCGGGGPTCIGTNFECPATVANSSGNAATICATGSDVASDNDLTLTATGMPTLNPTFGYFLNSMAQNPAGFNPPGSQGQLCIGPAGMGRYVGNVFNATGTGEGSLVLDLNSTPTPSGPVSVQAGETWYWTAWFRDSNPGSTSNFSDAVCVTFQ